MATEEEEPCDAERSDKTRPRTLTETRVQGERERKEGGRERKRERSRWTHRGSAGCSHLGKNVKRREGRSRTTGGVERGNRRKMEREEAEETRKKRAFSVSKTTRVLLIVTHTDRQNGVGFRLPYTNPCP